MSQVHGFESLNIPSAIDALVFIIFGGESKDRHHLIDVHFLLVNSSLLTADLDKLFHVLFQIYDLAEETGVVFLKAVLSIANSVQSGRLTHPLTNRFIALVSAVAH